MGTYNKVFNTRRYTLVHGFCIFMLFFMGPKELINGALDFVQDDHIPMLTKSCCGQLEGSTYLPTVQEVVQPTLGIPGTFLKAMKSSTCIEGGRLVFCFRILKMCLPLPIASRCSIARGKRAGKKVFLCLLLLLFSVTALLNTATAVVQLKSNSVYQDTTADTVSPVSAHGRLEFTSQKTGVGAYTEIQFVRIYGNHMIIKKWAYLAGI